MKAYLALIKVPQLVITGKETGILKILILPEMNLEIWVRVDSVKIEPMQESLTRRLQYFKEHQYPVVETELTDIQMETIFCLMQAHDEIRILARDIESITLVPA